MNDKSNVISLGDMLKSLEESGDVVVEYSDGSWDCTIIDVGIVIKESKCYSHPYYAVKEIYDAYVKESME